MQSNLFILSVLFGLLQTFLLLFLRNWLSAHKNQTEKILGHISEMKIDLARQSEQLRHLVHDASRYEEELKALKARIRQLENR